MEETVLVFWRDDFNSVADAVQASRYSLVSFLLITSSLLVSINLQLSVRAADTAEYANCSQPITCGGSVESSLLYPFWGANRAEYCGKSGFEVTCQDTVPMISMGSVDFRILNMSASGAAIPTVTVAREDYWNDICPSNYVNTSLNFSLFDYASGPQNVSFPYCNPNASTAFVAMAATMGISVSSFKRVCNSSVQVYFLTETQTAKISSQNTYGDCSNVVLVPVSATATEELDNNKTSIQKAIDGGFDLNVQNVDTGLCNNCVASGGVCGQTTTDASFMCFCQDSSSTKACNGNSLTNPNSSSGSNASAKIIGVTVGALGVGALGAILSIYISRKRMIFFKFFKKGKRNELDIEAFISNYGSIAPVRYSYSNVLKMTNSFEDQIGKGGYGTVYKGMLTNGLPVAVKILSETKGDGEEFINEVASIGRTSHVNVVTLSGFCYERNKRALIYEYMPNGSLDKFIHNQGSFKACHLEWKTLSEIAVGVARGLEYLHRGCNTRILHFDIKPQNILLDKDFCPKISDFGLAKLCMAKESIVSMMGTRGTVGYIAPEVFSRNFGGVSHKSDVYSYGMLVLEMVGARRNLHCEVSHTSETFPHCVYKDLELANDESIFRAIPKEENEIVRKMILISLACIQTIPFDRPSMSKVVEMLEGPLHSLTVPPKPILFSPTRSTTNEQTGTDDEESIYAHIPSI